MEFIEYFTICLTGALSYGLIEIAWRGFTHWSMLLAGGLCFCLIYLTDICLSGSLLKKSLFCAAGITLIEFCFGLLFNIILHQNVWDYSGVPGNIMGQICLLFTVIWMVLSLPALLLGRLFRRFVFRHTPAK